MSRQWGCPLSRRAVCTLLQSSPMALILPNLPCGETAGGGAGWLLRGFGPYVLHPNNTQAGGRLVRRRQKRQHGPGVGASVENPYSKDYQDSKLQNLARRRRLVVVVSRHHRGWWGWRLVDASGRHRGHAILFTSRRRVLHHQVGHRGGQRGPPVVQGLGVDADALLL